MRTDLGRGFGQRRYDFPPGNACSKAESDRLSRLRDPPGGAVARPAALALHDQATAVDEGLQAVLQGSAGRRRGQGIADLPCGPALRVRPHDFLDRLQVLFPDAPCHRVLDFVQTKDIRNIARICAIINCMRKISCAQPVLTDAATGRELRCRDCSIGLNPAFFPAPAAQGTWPHRHWTAGSRPSFRA